MTAGGSAARQAAALRAGARRGLWRRLLAALGFPMPDSAREAVAARWDLGAAAEQETARMLHALRPQGWHILNDRALPGSRANLDHVLVSPCGTAVVVLDTKRWHARRQTVLVGGRVHCGVQDRHGQIEAVGSYARRVAAVLGLPESAVWPLLVVHGSPIAGGHLQAPLERGGVVYVLGTAYLVPTLASSPDPGRVDVVRAEGLARHVGRVLPPYGG